jgi:hypothetical protein
MPQTYASERHPPLALLQGLHTAFKPLSQLLASAAAAIQSPLGYAGGSTSTSISTSTGGL